MTTALVLAGHGSHITPETAGLVWSHVDALRARGLADEITAAFWKEMPTFARVFDTLTADDITVIPLFTARGYFTQTVIPAEMRLEEAVTRHDGKTIRYARTLNEHPFLSTVVRQRVVDTMRQYQLAPESTAVAILGHSTRKNPESRKATEAQADQIRAAGLVREVVDAYLDDTPEISEIYSMTSAPTVIAVPYFLALGSHTTIDVPEALGLEPGQREAVIQGRRVLYTDPVGKDAALRDVMVELAKEAGAPLYAEQQLSAWAGFPSAGRDQLVQAVLSAGELPFGQLTLTPTEVGCGDSAAQTFTAPAELRQFVRTTPEFRPLPTENNLPGGWRVPISDPTMLYAVVETVYPGVVAHWAAEKKGTLNVTPLDQLIERQTGMFRDLAVFSAAENAAAVESICGHCVLSPRWALQYGSLPCPEACPIWLAEALERTRE